MRKPYHFDEVAAYFCLRLPFPPVQTEGAFFIWFRRAYYYGGIEITGIAKHIFAFPHYRKGGIFVRFFARTLKV